MKNDLISDNEVNDLFVNIKNLTDQSETWMCVVSKSNINWLTI